MKKQKEMKGTKMVKLTIYYYTTANGEKLPEGWVLNQGAVNISANPKHKIKSQGCEYFSPHQNTIQEAVDKTLKKAGLVAVNQKEAKIVIAAEKLRK